MEKEERKGNRKGRRREGKDVESGGGADGWKVAFWNVAGLNNKDKDFWENIKRWDIIVLCETWVEERGWNRIKERLPRGYRWEKQWAVREERKGRARGGMLIGVKKELIEDREGFKVGKEGVMLGEVKLGEENWRVIGVYVGKGIENMSREVEGWLDGGGRWKVLIGGDFNARVGKEGGGVECVKGEDRTRRAKDEVKNKEGAKLISWLEEKGLGIMNGCMKGDEEGEYTFTGGRGNTCIDFVIGDEEVRERIESLKVGDRIDSDHHPIEVEVKREGRRKDGEKEKEKRRVWRGKWDEEGREEFRKKLGSCEPKKERMMEQWEGLKERVKVVIREVEEERKEAEGEEKRRGWWDEECWMKKREVRKSLRAWRRKGVGEKEFRTGKKEYKELCERKRKEENERWERMVGKAKRESEVWEIVNRERRKRKRVNEGIEMGEWKEHFMRELGGVENKVVKGGNSGGGERVNEEREKEIDREEMGKVIRRIKEGKAWGIDEIPAEVWKYGGEELEEWAREFCNSVWRGEGWPEEWNEGIIIPIVKKGEGEKVTDYRGVTLLSTIYKVYVAVLAERIREEVERKRIVPHNQTGFRKGMGTIDNIYVINYLINKQLGKKGGKLIAMFVDLKAAFDSVDRKVLLTGMRKQGVREGLIRRVEEVLRETKSRVRIGDEIGESFWTARGVRQGCPLSPILFNIVIADLEEQMKKVKWGGVKLGDGKVYTLAYADDMVLLAESEDEMRSMKERLEEYLDGKKLELNAEKTKIVRFRRGGGRERKMEWRWKGKKIEEAKEIKYLGYMLQKNGGQEAQIRERGKKAAAIVGQVWGIGKRRFGKDWGRRLWLFDRLVWTVMGYGVEIWGWKEREELERIEERYLRWVLGVEGKTPWYMVREEIQREKLNIRAGRRAWSFEKRLREGKGSELARDCWEEMKERVRRDKVKGGWEEERVEFFEKKGIGREDIGKRLEEMEKGEGWYGELESKERERQRMVRWEKIRSSRYNKWYQWIKGEGVPEYLKNGWGEERYSRIARFRLGNEVEGRKYWEGDEEKVKCRLCGGETETWEHVWEICREWSEKKGSWQEEFARLLGEKGEGEGWMREVEEERKRWGKREEGGGNGRGGSKGQRLMREFMIKREEARIPEERMCVCEDGDEEAREPNHLQVEELG